MVTYPVPRRTSTPTGAGRVHTVQIPPGTNDHGPVIDAVTTNLGTVRAAGVVGEHITRRFRCPWGFISENVGRDQRLDTIQSSSMLKVHTPRTVPWWRQVICAAPLVNVVSTVMLAVVPGGTVRVAGPWGTSRRACPL